MFLRSAAVCEGPRGAEGAEGGGRPRAFRGWWAAAGRAPRGQPLPLPGGGWGELGPVPAVTAQSVPLRLFAGKWECEPLVKCFC